MKCFVMAATVAVATVVFAPPALARHHIHHHYSERAVKAAEIIDCNRQGCHPVSPTLEKGTERFNGTPRYTTPTRHVKRSLRPSLGLDANGNRAEGVVRSGKTGATARVSPRYAARFQAYVDDLEAHGAAVYYMGGLRRGRCSNASQHPCGSALDVCQDYRGHVSGARDCHLPHPVEMAAIAARHGLEEGSVWCHSDYGHAQIHPSAGACSYRRYATGSWGHGRVRHLRLVSQ